MSAADELSRLCIGLVRHNLLSSPR
jgi:hypothetical protein